MQNVFVGSWTLEPAESLFDPNHRPAEAIMHWELHDEGFYLMKAEGVNAKGEKCAERPQKMVPDGRPYPVPDLPGLTAVVPCLPAFSALVRSGFVLRTAAAMPISAPVTTETASVNSRTGALMLMSTAGGSA